MLSPTLLAVILILNFLWGWSLFPNMFFKILIFCWSEDHTQVRVWIIANVRFGNIHVKTLIGTPTSNSLHNSFVKSIHNTHFFEHILLFSFFLFNSVVFFPSSLHSLSLASPPFSSLFHHFLPVDFSGFCSGQLYLLYFLYLLFSIYLCFKPVLFFPEWILLIFQSPPCPLLTHQFFKLAPGHTVLLTHWHSLSSLFPIKKKFIFVTWWALAFAVWQSCCWYMIILFSMVTFRLSCISFYIGVFGYSFLCVSHYFYECFFESYFIDFCPFKLLSCLHSIFIHILQCAGTPADFIRVFFLLFSN